MTQSQKKSFWMSWDNPLLLNTPFYSCIIKLKPKVYTTIKKTPFGFAPSWTFCKNWQFSQLCICPFSTTQTLSIILVLTLDQLLFTLLLFYFIFAVQRRRVSLLQAAETLCTLQLTVNSQFTFTFFLLHLYHFSLGSLDTNLAGKKWGRRGFLIKGTF